MAYAEEDYFTEHFASKILHDIAIEQNVIDPVYEINESNGKGFGFLSYIIRIKVKGKNKEQCFIIKAAQQNEGIRKLLSIRPFFLQEITYYKDIFPAFENFQRKRNVTSPFKSYPKCYKTMDPELNEMLVLENINQSGFEVFEKSKQMDENHIKLVLREYGKFHAISLAMKDQDAELFKNSTKNVANTLSTDNITSELFDLYEHAINMAKAAFDPISESKIVSAIANFSEDIVGVFKSLTDFKGKSRVIIHGDCWCNNMMFKYGDENSTMPIEVRFYDFQLGRLTTPVVDLSYFLYTAMSEEMLKNLNYYLQIYHDSLREHMREMGSDMEKYYPFASLIDEWKMYCKFGIILATIVYRVVLREKDEAAALTDEPVNISLKDTFLKKSKNDGLINERYRRLFLHLYENGFI